MKLQFFLFFLWWCPLQRGEAKVEWGIFVVVVVIGWVCKCFIFGVGLLLPVFFYVRECASASFV